MRVRIRGLVVLFTIVLMVTVSAAFAQQRRRSTPAAAPPPPQADLKIKYRKSTAGQSYESATMIKGKRERSEMRAGSGSEIINITQCDLKRTIQISDQNRKYVITPMETTDASSTNSNPGSAVATAEPVRKGGVVTYVTTLNDTGERKEMFGFTARHIKSSITIESSADACNPMKQRMETDGWYIDLTFGLDCNLDRAPMARYSPVAPGGCRDRVVTRQVGAGRKGYPLSETTTMYGPDGSAVFTSTKEVVELSREPLDAALFDVPAGYTETTNSQELYAAPTSMSSIMAQANQPEPNTEQSAASVAPAVTKNAGALRVGVVAINNRSDRAISLDSLRQRLIGGIQSDGIEAVPLTGISATEIEIEAKAKQCDFILYTDVMLKTSAAKKLGGFLGRAAGVSGVEKTESRVDFRLFAVGETAPRLQSTATAKEEGDDASAGVSIDSEAKKVSAEVRKKPRG